MSWYVASRAAHVLSSHTETETHRCETLLFQNAQLSNLYLQNQYVCLFIFDVSNLKHKPKHKGEHEPTNKSRCNIFNQ